MFECVCVIRLVYVWVSMLTSLHGQCPLRLTHSPLTPAFTPAGSGPYSAVGFSYGGQSAAADESSSSSGSEDDSDEMGAGQTVEEVGVGPLVLCSL